MRFGIMGMQIDALVSGWLSDRLGRKPVMLAALFFLSSALVIIPLPGKGLSKANGV
jgi:MFS family permease